MSFIIVNYNRYYLNISFFYNFTYIIHMLKYSAVAQQIQRHQEVNFYQLIAGGI